MSLRSIIDITATSLMILGIIIGWISERKNKDDDTI